MRGLLSFFIALFAMNTDLYTAEAGMPQLDPTFWASQAFWLILFFYNTLYCYIKILSDED